MTVDILPGQLSVDGAMWLVHGNEYFVVITGSDFLEGLRIEVEIMLIRHSH